MTRPMRQNLVPSSANEWLRGAVDASSALISTRKLRMGFFPAMALRGFVSCSIFVVVSDALVV